MNILLTIGILVLTGCVSARFGGGDFEDHLPGKRLHDNRKGHCHSVDYVGALFGSLAWRQVADTMWWYWCSNVSHHLGLWTE